MSPRRLLLVVLVVSLLAGPAVAGAAPSGKGVSHAPVAFTWDAALAQLRAVLVRFLPAPPRGAKATPDCVSGMDPNGCMK
jgi:hypothetical protein